MGISGIGNCTDIFEKRLGTGFKLNKTGNETCFDIKIGREDSELNKSDTINSEQNSNKNEERYQIYLANGTSIDGSILRDRFFGEKIEAPYQYLADEANTITYKDVVFFCNREKQELCLGDMSNSADVLDIPLSGGGCLRVNRNNIGDLAKAIGMFSPEDVGQIMRAISEDSHCNKKQNEIDNIVNKLEETADIQYSKKI